MLMVLFIYYTRNPSTRSQGSKMISNHAKIKLHFTISGDFELKRINVPFILIIICSGFPRRDANGPIPSATKREIYG